MDKLVRGGSRIRTPAGCAEAARDQIVGIMEVSALAHPDPKDDTGVWKCVDVRGVEPLPKAVTLAAVKQSPKLANMVLAKNARLSVQPVTSDEWDIIMRIAERPPPPE